MKCCLSVAALREAAYDADCKSNGTRLLAYQIVCEVQVRQLQPQAVASWWQPGHPGWAIYPVDSEQFMSTGALDNVSVPNESTLVAPPPPDSPGTAIACCVIVVCRSYGRSQQLSSA